MRLLSAYIKRDTIEAMNEAHEMKPAVPAIRAKEADMENAPVWPPKGEVVCQYPRDHFLRQFDRYEEGEPRLAACAAHAAYIFNSYEQEKADHTALIEVLVERLRRGDTPVAIALDLQELITDRRC